MPIYYSYKNIPVQSFGGKADGLISLSKKGFNVPPFYVIPYPTLLNIITEKYVLTTLIDEWIENVNPDKDSLWAVRSSAEVEDGENKSYAGIFSTEINCKIHDLEAAFKKVIAGFINIQAERSAYYETEDFEFNIVLQQMICGKISGVGFSVNPLEQASENPIINIIPGLGIKLVSGEENAMMIDLTSPPKIISEDELYNGELYESGSGYKKVTLTKDELFEKVNPFLKELRESLLKIDQLQGHPVDTEFTVDNNKIYWLQVRPITTLIPRGDYIVWDNSNMDVNFPGMVMPLTVSFVKHSYSKAYINMCKFLGAGDSFFVGNNSLFENTVGVIKGGMYYNVTSYQKLLYQMPFGKKTSKLFPKMIGADDAEFRKPPNSASLLAYFQLFINLIKTILFFGISKNTYTKQYNKIQAEFNTTSLKNQSHLELIKYFKTLEFELGKNWHVPILNSLFSMMVYNSLNKAIFRSKLHQEYPNFINDSLMGSGQVVSMEIVYALQDLTHHLHQNSEVKNRILEMESNQVLPYLQKNHSADFNRITSYLDKFGVRSDEGELKLETVNYKENPDKFVAFLKSYLSVPQHTIKSKQKFNYRDVLKETYKNNPFKLFLFKKTISLTIRLVRDRENFRFIRTKTFDMVRQIFREIDRKLLLDKYILASGDSLYLHFEELMHPDKYLSQYKDIIRERKRLYATYENMEHPIRYHEVNNELYPIAEKQSTSKNGLNGIACSSGIIEGEVLLVTAENIHKLELAGKILVARFFEPGWVGLFSRAEGIISERGSLLSHTSILCREMGIPAIISAKNITKNLKNGDRIKMNGATGSIEKVAL